MSLATWWKARKVARDLRDEYAILGALYRAPVPLGYGELFVMTRLYPGRMYPALRRLAANGDIREHPRIVLEHHRRRYQLTRKAQP